MNGGNLVGTAVTGQWYNVSQGIAHSRAIAGIVRCTDKFSYGQ